MTHLRVVPDRPAEEAEKPVRIETLGALLWEFHGMVADGHIGAALLRVADWAETYADVPLPELKR